jgi:hypothetical protein
MIKIINLQQSQGNYIAKTIFNCYNIGAYTLTEKEGGQNGC